MTDEMIRMRLNKEVLNLSVFIHIHNVTVIRMIVRMNQQCGIRLFTMMEIQHVFHIEVHDRISIEHKKFFCQFFLQISQCSSRSQWLLLLKVFNRYAPFSTVAKIFTNLITKISDDK